MWAKIHVLAIEVIARWTKISCQSREPNGRQKWRTIGG